MKFVGALALVAGVSSYNITALIERKVNEVFTPRKDGVNINIPSYLILDCGWNERRVKKGAYAGNLLRYKKKCVGSIGNGGQRMVKFMRTVDFDSVKKTLKLGFRDSGDIGDYPFSNLWHPRYNKPFWTKDDIDANWSGVPSHITHVRKSGFHKWGGKTINKHQFYFKETAELTGFQVSDGTISVTANVAGNSKIPRKFPKKFWGYLKMKTGKWNFDVEASAAEMCFPADVEVPEAAPMRSAGISPDCSLNMELSGKYYGKNKLYSINADAADMKITVTANEHEWVVSSAPTDDMTAITCHFQKTAPNAMPKKLVFQIVSNEAAVGAAVGMKINPLMMYYALGNDTWLTRATTFVWSDKRIEAMEREFDCSPIFAATQFESDFVADAITKLRKDRWEEGDEEVVHMTVQEFVSDWCNSVNTCAINWLNDKFVPKLRFGREFALNVTSPEAKIRYDNWYKINNFPVLVVE